MQSLQQFRRHRLKDVSNFTPATELVAKAAFDLDCDEIPESDQRVAGTLHPTRRPQDSAGLLRV